MKDKLYSLALTGVIALNTLALPAVSLAQDNVNTPVLDNAQPGGAATQNDNANTGTGANADDGFNPWWLLPLILVPLVFLLWPRNKTTETRQDRTDEYIGAKGGKAGTKDKNDTRDEDYDL